MVTIDLYDFFTQVCFKPKNCVLVVILNARRDRYKKEIKQKPKKKEGKRRNGKNATKKIGIKGVNTIFTRTLKKH